MNFKSALLYGPIAAFGASWAIWSYSVSPGFDPQGRATRSRSIDLLEEGHVQVAIAQSRSLLDALRSAGWDHRQVDPSLKRLPDQDYDEVRHRRIPGHPSFAFPRPGASSSPGGVYDAVAFISHLYLLKDLQIVKGKEGVLRHSGFLIVGWKDGRGVEQVPHDKLRMLPKPGEEGLAWLYVWPGLASYNESLPRLGEPLTSKAARPPARE